MPVTRRAVGYSACDRLLSEPELWNYPFSQPIREIQNYAAGTTRKSSGHRRDRSIQERKERYSIRPVPNPRPRRSGVREDDALEDYV